MTAFAHHPGEPHSKKRWHQPSSRIGGYAMVALVALGALLALASHLADAASRQRMAAVDWEIHTLEVLETTARLRHSAVTTINKERGYLLTGDESYIAEYATSSASMRDDLDKLARQVLDNSAQSQRLAGIEARTDYHLGVLDRMISLAQDGRTAAAIARVRANEGRNSIDAIMADIDSFELAERALLAERVAAAERARARSDLMEKAMGIVGLLLLVLGTLAAIALRRSLARESAATNELRRIALTDELTGLANRRELLNSLDRMIASAKRSGRPLSLAILDIDRFKRVNDTYGHPAGDEVIKTVGNIATQVMREQDLIGRLGGEEFVVVFPDIEAERALEACERLRRAIADTPIVVESGVILKVTLSSGLAQFRDGDDRTTLIARADEALYEAKEGGRDQVRLAA